MDRSNYDYKSMSREELLVHVKAYAKAIHALAEKCQRLTIRVQRIEANREFFHG